MSEIKLPFTQPVGMVIAGVTILVAIGGYVLYFQSQSHLNRQMKELDALKEKYTQSDSAYTEIKAKYDAVYDDMKKLGDASSDSKLKLQDCQQRLEMLQAKLNAASQKPATTAPDTSVTPTPTTPTQQDHPIKQLDTPEKPAAPTETPSATVTPPTTPTPPSPNEGKPTN